MKNLNPFFSIILPVYNVEMYLDRCINSILQQDFIDYEILLIDDGSKETCANLCDAWADKNDRVRVIHKVNAGLGMARNTGLDNALGRYIFFIDSDDYILPGMLEDVYRSIEENKTEIVFYGFQRMDRNGNLRFKLTPNVPKKIYNQHEEIKNELLPEFISGNPHTGKNFNICVSAWNCCISVEFLRTHELRFVSEREYINEDLYFYIEMFSCLKSVSILSKAYYCYCQNSGSLTFTYRENRFEKLKYCYSQVEILSNQLKYDGEIRLRLKSSFVANVIGTLKMEAGNIKQNGYRKSYRNIKKICSDVQFLEALNGYPQKYSNKNWALFRYLVRQKHFLTLLLLLRLQYLRKGV